MSRTEAILLRFDFLNDDFNLTHDMLLFNLFQPGLHTRQSLHFLVQAGLNLGPTGFQHPAQLLRGDFVVEQMADLLQREAHFLERQDAVQTRQLAESVITIAGEVIHPGGVEQTDFVVEAQGLDRDLAEP
jgi:hypothetical protein